MENTNAAAPTNPVVVVAVGSSSEHSNSSHLCVVTTGTRSPLWSKGIL